MSQTNLDALADERPDLREPLKGFATWLNEHPDPIIVPSKVRGIEAYALAAVLLLLTKRGLLHKRYKVKTPSGVYADGEFEDVSEIPPQLPDRFNNYFDTAEADVTPVFAREGV